MSPQTRPRLLVGLATIAAVTAATLLGATPAGAVDTSTQISGVVHVPASAAASASIIVLAWKPDDVGLAYSSIAGTNSDGEFTLAGLDPDVKYQVDVLDRVGGTKAGYYAGGKIVATSAKAELVTPGTTDLDVKLTASSTLTTATLVLPEDGTTPAWSPAAVMAVEPGTGRPAALANYGVTGRGVAPASRTQNLLGTPPARGASASATPADASPIPPLTFRGLFPGVAYTLLILTSFDEGPGSTVSGYYYTGDAKVVRPKLANAASFLGSTATLQVHVLAAERKTVPAISGNAKVGATLRVVPGKWKVAGTTTFQWLRNGREIAGATGAKFKVRPADRGALISVRAVHVAGVAGYAPGYAWSTKTAPIAAS
ncbi:hypothetical protein [Cellulomonas composti]|nr:hypothetical protein [Cellulomonas composti]